MSDKHSDKTRSDDVQSPASEPEAGGCGGDGGHGKGSPIGAWDLAKIDYLCKEIHLGAVGLLAASEGSRENLHTIASFLYLAERCLTDLAVTDQALKPLKDILEDNTIALDRLEGEAAPLHICETGWIHDPDGGRHRCVPKP